MIAKPSPTPSPLDPKLRRLSDPQLAERLRSEHPELFSETAQAHASALQSDEARAQEPASEIGRALALIGMLLALLASYALGALMRAHWNDDVTPYVSLGTLVPQVRHRALPDHRNLSPAAAQRFVAAAERLAQRQVALARPSVQSAVRPQHAVVALARIHPRPHVAPRPVFREEVKTVHAPALMASTASQTASDAAAEAAAAAAADADTGDDVSGRQMSHGPVWAEGGGPGAIIPGGVVLGRGGSGGGGGMPGGCRRGGFRP